MMSQVIDRNGEGSLLKWKILWQYAGQIQVYPEGHGICKTDYEERHTVAGPNRARAHHDTQ